MDLTTFSGTIQDRLKHYIKMSQPESVIRILKTLGIDVIKQERVIKAFRKFEKEFHNTNLTYKQLYPHQEKYYTAIRELLEIIDENY